MNFVLKQRNGLNIMLVDGKIWGIVKVEDTILDTLVFSRTGDGKVLGKMTWNDDKGIRINGIQSKEIVESLTICEQ